MPSTDPLGAAHRQQLLDVARASIQHGLAHRQAMPVNPSDYPQALQAWRASFVTLHQGDALRGCIGALAASQPLVQDVAIHAYAAAFDDPRFPAVSGEELALLKLHISILSPPQPLPAASEAEVLAQLRPGIDGVILSFRHHRATFLPAVWEQLPDPRQFLAHLRNKAGLAADFWSPQLRVERYTTEQFGS